MTFIAQVKSLNANFRKKDDIMCKIIVAANQKGGVGKTTACQHLAYCLAESGRRVLTADLDPQCNLTVSLTKPDTITPRYCVNDLLTFLVNDQPLPPMETYIAKSGKIDFISGHKELDRLERILQSEMGTEGFLAFILAPLRASYDYIIIDTNRANSPLMVNALVAADSVLIPVSPEFYSTEGLSDLIATVLKNKRRLNARIEFEGILFSMCDLRTNLYRETRAAVEAAFAGQIPVFQSAIPRTVQVGDAIRRGMSVMEYNPQSPASLAYELFAKEVIANAQQNTAQAHQDDGTGHSGNAVAC